MKAKQPNLPIRIFLIFFWIAFIFFLLYAPTFKSKSTTRTLNIFAWSDTFDEELIRSFEAETGIKLHFNYYETNEELLVKLRSTKGQGHDLIIPSDYSIKILIDQELIKPLDYSRIDFKDRLHPKLLGHDFDPQNTYSLPLYWEAYGLSYDNEYFGGKLCAPSWKHIFNPEGHRVAMTDDAIEAFNIASLHLHGQQTKLTPSQAAITRQTLIQQKQHIEAYGNYRVAYLIATKNCPLALTSSSYNFRMVQEYPNIGFAIPQEGSFISIENIAIPAKSEHDTLTYTFLNYIYRAENIQKRCARYAHFPPTLDGLPSIHPEYTQTFNYALSRLADFCFFRHLVSEQLVRDVWIDVKS